jgi:hypothetical protein
MSAERRKGFLHQPRYCVPAGNFERPGNQASDDATPVLPGAFVFVRLAIPFGHITRSQCPKTGEQCARLALAGLIIAYIWIGIVAVGLLVLVGYYNRY